MARLFNSGGWRGAIVDYVLTRVCEWESFVYVLAFFFSGKRANELSNSWSSMTNICDRICRMKLGEVRYLESLVVICGNRIIEDRGFDSRRSSFQWSLAFVKLIVIKWLISFECY